MITDNQTNFLFLADRLPKKYPNFFAAFEQLLQQSNIAFDFIPDTKDIWAVDYMPIQIQPQKFVRFLYQPPYLTQYKKHRETISDVDAICNLMNINPVKSDIILDGGNLVRTTNKVIMTDRVFVDNPRYERKELVKELYKLLEVDRIYFIPEQPHDFTGHADGMIRFLNEHTVLINDYKEEDETFQRAFDIAIHNTGLDYFKIPYNVYSNIRDSQANGDYINYLQMDHTVVVPTFGFNEDDEVVKLFEKLFTGETILTIDANEIANEGGVLNCITWNINKGVSS